MNDKENRIKEKMEKTEECKVNSQCIKNKISKFVSRKLYEVLNSVKM